MDSLWEAFEGIIIISKILSILGCSCAVFLYSIYCGALINTHTYVCVGPGLLCSNFS